jgi:thiol:disulfide interchange protein DsbA
MVMKKRLLICISLLFVFSTTFGSKIKEGTHYERIKSPCTKEVVNHIEVTEYFTFACPSCYKLEQGLNSWLEKKPVNIVFKRIPLTFGSKTLRNQAKGYYVAKAFGKEHEYTEAIFTKIHLDDKAMSSKEAIVGLLISIGISKEDAQDSIDAMALDMQIISNEEKTIRNKILSMPTFVIDGKYKTDPSIAGGFDQYWHVVDYVIEIVDKENKLGKV